MKGLSRWLQPYPLIVLLWTRCWERASAPKSRLPPRLLSCFCRADDLSISMPPPGTCCWA